jgi:serine/threonine protein phosphatase PrpC
MNAVTENPFTNSSAALRACGGLRVVSDKFFQSRATGIESEDAAIIFEHDGVTVAVVADGLGSAKEGRVAANRAVDALKQNFPSRPRNWNAGRACEEIVRHLDRRLWQEGLARFESPELASTIAVAALEGDRLFALNAGDSRIYLWRENELRQISTDHREKNPQRHHVLTRALGLAEELSLTFVEIPVQPADLILLCTDGVTDVLDDTMLAELLSQNSSALKIVAEAARRATDENRDDITAVTLRVLQTGTARHPHEQNLRVPAALKAGDVIDGFTLRRSFRTSDRIWLAARQGDSFVLKFPPRAATTDENLHAAFIREVWHATQLESEFFPAAFVPENATVRFYAQEYLHAPTLKKFLADNGPLPPAQAVELGKFLLRAEQFLLGHGFVHGDLKPENILVLRGENTIRFKLIDLGSVAEIFSQQGRAGTPSYLAPERFTGAAMTERTEIFSIGAVLYETLTGRLPYGEIEPFQKPTFAAPRSVTALNHHIPPWLDAIVLRATAADPERRQQNYSEILFELENPAKVEPFFRAGTPLLERNPLLFYKIGFFVLLPIVLFLLLRLLELPHR